MLQKRFARISHIAPCRRTATRVWPAHSLTYLCSPEWSHRVRLHHDVLCRSLIAVMAPAAALAQRHLCVVTVCVQVACDAQLPCCQVHCLAPPGAT